MKYRIVEYFSPEGVYYTLQLKKWLRWKTVMKRDYHPSDGVFVSEQRFTSKNSAFDHYRRYYMKTIKKIVEEG
jgi:hypothetical protein